jgi:hypothetical protein
MEIARLQSKLNSKSWLLKESQKKWDDHLEATLAEAVVVLNNECDADVAAYDSVHDMALEMADFFRAGVVEQFPMDFSGQQSILRP